MAKHNCENCRFRAGHDRKPRSPIGRVWRWHINWCPGWKRFMTALSDSERDALIKTYQLNPSRYNRENSQKHKGVHQ